MTKRGKCALLENIKSDIIALLVGKKPPVDMERTDILLIF